MEVSGIAQPTRKEGVHNLTEQINLLLLTRSASMTLRFKSQLF